MEKQKQNDDDGQTLVEQKVADAEEASVTAVPGDSPSSPTATATTPSSSSGEKTEEEIERRRRRKEAHRRHRRERELQKQILEAERLRINYLQDPRKRIGRDYEQWQAGQTVQTPEAQQKLTILRRIDDGHAGVVFKVRDEAGSMLALKVPRSESEKQFKKLHQEVAKNARMQSLGLPVAEITEEGGDYLVKRWIDGLRGDHWFIQWNEKGRPLDDLGWRRLCEMFDMLAAKNIYVQNLKDLNMIWDGQKWVVIDVGYFKAGLTPQQALGRYYETFDGRWNKPRYNRGRFMFLCPTIAALRGHSHPQHYIKRESARTAYQRGITSKSKTSTAEGDASGSGELLLPRIDTTNGGPVSPLLPGSKVGGLGASNGGSSEAINDIKRKQAEAAMAVLERANRKKKKKQRQAAAAAGGGGSKESDAVEGGAAAAAAATTTTTAVTTTVKDESGEEKTKKRSAKDEEKEKKELKGKKEKELKEKKEKKEKELREKRDQKEKEKKEKEQKKKK